MPLEMEIISERRHILFIVSHNEYCMSHLKDNFRRCFRNKKIVFDIKNSFGHYQEVGYSID